MARNGPTTPSDRWLPGAFGAPGRPRNRRPGSDRRGTAEEDRVRRSTAMSALAVTVVAAGAMVALANSGSAAPSTAVQSSVQSNALSGNWYGAAPYVMPLDNTPPDLTQVMAATGQKSFELAFVHGGGVVGQHGGRRHQQRPLGRR